MMNELNLSPKAESVVKTLISCKDPDQMGQIAAVDPQTGEVFYGKTIPEVVKIGREAKKDPKSIFFFVKVGYPGVEVLKNLQGYISQKYFPKIKGYIQDRRLYFAKAFMRRYSLWNLQRIQVFRELLSWIQVLFKRLTKIMLVMIQLSLREELFIL